MHQFSKEDLKKDNNLYTYVLYRINKELTVEQNTELLLEPTQRKYKELRLAVAEKMIGMLAYALDNYITNNTNGQCREDKRKYISELRKKVYLNGYDFLISEEYNRFISKYKQDSQHALRTKEE